MAKEKNDTTSSQLERLERSFSDFALEVRPHVADPDTFCSPARETDEISELRGLQKRLQEALSKTLSTPSSIEELSQEGLSSPRPSFGDCEPLSPTITASSCSDESPMFQMRNTPQSYAQEELVSHLEEVVFDYLPAGYSCDANYGYAFVSYAPVEEQCMHQVFFQGDHHQCTMGSMTDVAVQGLHKQMYEEIAAANFTCAQMEHRPVVMTHLSQV